jgi:uncharacterized cupredoxin-like copper-binding protein
MKSKIHTAIAGALVLGINSLILANSMSPSIAQHAGHTHVHTTYSAGEPGDPAKPARTINVNMREADGKMLFAPDRIEVRRGEQIRFLLRNSGELEHEFVLATTEENLKHAEEMKNNAEMGHDDPNAKRLLPRKSKELVWKFTKAGTFEYGCLIPGHREAGMAGTIVVK